MTPLPAASQGTLLVPSVAGAANVTGLLLAYTALHDRRGRNRLDDRLDRGGDRGGASRSWPGSSSRRGRARSWRSSPSASSWPRPAAGRRWRKASGSVGNDRSGRPAWLRCSATMFGTNLFLIGSVSGDAADRLAAPAGPGARRARRGRPAPPRREGVDPARGAPVRRHVRDRRGHRDHRVRDRRPGRHRGDVRARLHVRPDGRRSPRSCCSGSGSPADRSRESPSSSPASGCSAPRRAPPGSRGDDDAAGLQLQLDDAPAGPPAGPPRAGDRLGRGLPARGAHPALPRPGIPGREPAGRAARAQPGQPRCPARRRAMAARRARRPDARGRGPHRPRRRDRGIVRPAPHRARPAGRPVLAARPSCPRRSGGG